jgi:plasmid stabilization system protein ParE
MRIRYRAQALRDIDDIYRYLNERSPRGADNVLRAIYAGIHLIAEQPHASQRTDDPDIRVKSMRRYRYRIFYSIVIDENAVEIIHIRHTSRRPWTPTLQPLP